MDQAENDASSEDISKQSFIDKKASEFELQSGTSVAEHTSEFQNLVN